MKAHSTGGTRAHWVRCAISTGTAALLTIGSMAAAAWELGPGRGGPFELPGQQWTYGPGGDMGLGSSTNRFGEFGTPALERQSRFYGPGQHRVSGFDKAPSVAPGRYVHGPGAGGRGR